MLFIPFLIIMLGAIGEDAYNYSLFHVGSMNVYFIDLVICGTMIILLFNWQSISSSRTGPVLLPLAAFLVWIMICILRGMGQFSFSAIGESRVVLPLLFFVVSYALIMQARSLSSVLDSLGKFLAVSALGVLIVFILELHVGHRLSLSLMQEPEYAYGFLEDERGIRILGTLQTFTAGIFFIFVTLNLLYNNNTPNFYKLLALLMPIVMLVSMNRAAIISLVAGMGCYGFLLTKGRQRFKLIAISGLAIITILLSLKLFFPERYQDLTLLINSVTDPQMEATGTWLWRKQVEIGAIQIFLENPVAGEGFGGHWEAVVNDLIVEDPPHNEYLIILAKTGIIGLTLFVFVIWAVIKNYIKYYNKIPYYGRPFFDMIFIIVIASIPYGFAYAYVQTYGFFLGIFAGLLHRVMQAQEQGVSIAEGAYAL